MTQQEITKAFEGRWRIKGANLPQDPEQIKALCRDFFETGILLADGIEVVDADSSFDQWWELYQKKRGKDKCLKKWQKLSQKDRQACLNATPAYVASTPDVNFRKDPYTYLNNKSWNDEIYFRNTKPTIEQQRIAKLADIVVGQ